MGESSCALTSRSGCRCATSTPTPMHLLPYFLLTFYCFYLLPLTFHLLSTYYVQDTPYSESLRAPASRPPSNPRPSPHPHPTLKPHPNPNPAHHNPNPAHPNPNQADTAPLFDSLRIGGREVGAPGLTLTLTRILTLTLTLALTTDPDPKSDPKSDPGPVP